jgi:ABC-type sulfate transport system permease component
MEYIGTCIILALISAGLGAWSSWYIGRYDQMWISFITGFVMFPIMLPISLAMWGFYIIPDPVFNFFINRLYRAPQGE